MITNLFDAYTQYKEWIFPPAYEVIVRVPMTTPVQGSIYIRYMFHILNKHGKL